MVPFRVLDVQNNTIMVDPIAISDVVYLYMQATLSMRQTGYNYNITNITGFHDK